ncbi:MAG: HAD-IA family hydrolase [Pseudobacter sp.]|uniref:HAD-IA family hydrolase n=1 Tax=Pseudobacter sp. TaxID=2045420 RepID=UPI003F7FBF80
MSSTKLVVFDMAGTTVRDRGDVATAFITALAELGVPKPSTADVNEVMGFRKIDAIRILLDKYGAPEGADIDQLIENIHQRFTELMIGFYQNDKDLQPLPYAENLFRELHEKAVKVALNTGFTRPVTEAILSRLNWKNNPLIDMVICSDEVPEGRPEPYMIQAIMQQLGISSSREVVKVGDTEVDVQEGRNANCGLVISVTTGAATREQLQQFHPDHIIDSLEELPSLI